MSEKNETPNEKFKRIASNRTQKIIDMIRLLGNCGNSYVYEYSKEEVEKIFTTIEAELKEARKKFDSTPKKNDRFTL